MTKRFILLTAPKSGSNYFGSQISKIDDVIFLNSIFSKGYLKEQFNAHNKSANSKAGVLSGLMDLIISDKQIEKELIRLRTENPINWLLSIMNMDPGGYLGVKIHPYLDIWYQDGIDIKFSLEPDQIIGELVSTYKWSVFTMLRRDMFEQLASSLISIMAKYFNATTEPPELIKTGIIKNKDINQYIKILSIYKQCYEWINNYYKYSPDFHIWYEDLIEGNINPAILDYFEINTLPNVQADKLIKRPYEEVFEDYDYFREVINDF